MIPEIMNALVGNPYWFIFILGAILSFVIGYAVFDEKNEKPWTFGIIAAVAWMILGGLFLLFVWAVFTISNFFGIPLLVLFALIVVAVAAIVALSRVGKTIIVVNK